MNRLPTLGSDVVVDTGSIAPPEFSSTATGTVSPPQSQPGSGKHSRLSSMSSQTTISPTLSLTPTGTTTSSPPTAPETTSRVFNESTDLAKVKAEGLRALNRFVSASTNGGGGGNGSASTPKAA